MPSIAKPQAAPETRSSENHDLLISVNGKVDGLAESMDKLATHTAGEFDRLWRHTAERDRLHSDALQTTTDKLASSIERISEKQSNFGKPNISAIVSIAVLVGSIAVAFIAPIKADIDRGNKASEALAAAVLVRDERITSLKGTQDEVKTKVGIMASTLQEIAEHGSNITRERLSILENDLRWMRGEKKNRNQE